MAEHESPRRTLRERVALFVGVEPTVVLVAGVALLGLVARLVFLGERIAHQDEARVAYWILQYLETGVFEYRPIIHGPFLPIVNRWVFALVGPSDFSARLIVAVVGAALPLTALLYRDHLRDSETVALAVLLAATPVLLYYSRFMRSDVLVATFMFAGLGFLVRTIDTGRPRYLYAAVGFVALGFTTKENALLYLVSWLGGLALLFDHRLFLARLRDADPRGVAKEYAWSTALDLWAWRWRIVVALLEFFAIIVFFYAPRGGGYGGFNAPVGDVGLWMSLGRLAGGDPGMFLTVVERATMGSWGKFMDVWGHSRDHAYLPFLRDYLATLRAGALGLSVLAAVGFLADRYSAGGPRDLVALGGYWGVASVLGYPLATDIQAPWATVHAVVPLAIPAAVGLALIYRWGAEAFAEDDEVGVAIAVVVVLLLSAQVGWAAYATVYTNEADPASNELVQYAQSSSPGLKPTLVNHVRDVARQNRGVDVLFYGATFYLEKESYAKFPGGAGGGGWFARLPVSWYFELNDHYLGSDTFRVDSTDDRLAIAETNRSRLPPVIVTLADESYYGPGKDTVADIAEYLDGYVRYEFQRYGWSSAFVVLIDEDWQDRASVRKGLATLSTPDGEAPDGPIDLPSLNGTNVTDGPGFPALDPRPAAARRDGSAPSSGAVTAKAPRTDAGGVSPASTALRGPRDGGFPVAPPGRDRGGTAGTAVVGRIPTATRERDRSAVVRGV